MLNAGTNILKTNTVTNGAHFSRHVAHIRKQLNAEDNVNTFHFIYWENEYNNRTCESEEQEHRSARSGQAYTLTDTLAVEYGIVYRRAQELDISTSVPCRSAQL